jgi:hypothetical protein
MRIGVEEFVGADGGAMSFRESGSRKGAMVSRLGRWSCPGGRFCRRRKVVTNRGRKSKARQRLAADAVSDGTGLGISEIQR